MTFKYKFEPTLLKLTLLNLKLRFLKLKLIKITSLTMKPCAMIESFAAWPEDTHYYGYNHN